MTCISIIIPVYNARDYLSRCIESVMGQSFTGDTEIILVDDGSTDGSGAICDGYARTIPYISVFHIDNCGASRARRFGLEKSRGDYVTFVDSDDYVSPDYITTLHNLEKQFDTGISACRVKLTSPGENQNEDLLTSDSCILEGDTLFHRFFKYEFWGLCGKLYRKDLLFDIPFPEETLSEDYFVMVQLLNKVGRMAYSAAPLYFYEHHPDSLSQQIVSSRSFEEFVNVKGVYDFVSAKMPRYKSYALSNVVETTVKLLKNGSCVFSLSQRQEMVRFIRQHIWQIVNCRPLNTKVAILALYLCIR